VTDVERGTGLSLRFASAAPGSRLRVDAGLARHRFEPAADPALAQGAALVPLRRRASDAAYLDVGYDLVRPRAEPGPKATRLAAAYRFERVDPLFRPIGGVESVQADLRLHTAELTGGWGALLGQVAHTWSHDNLGALATLLRTDTGLTTATLAAPLAALRTGSAPSSSPWPTVTWTLQRTSQVGGAIPAEGGFASAAQVPDQRNTLQTLRSEWTFTRWRAGYALSSTLVDNRQPGRERADFDTLAQTVTLAITVGTRLDFGLDLGRDRIRSLLQDSTATTARAGLTGAWRPTSRATVTIATSRTRLRDPAAGRTAVNDVMLEGAHAIPLPKLGAGRPQGRLFARWTWQSTDLVQTLLGAGGRRDTWTVATSLSFTVF
jgi:hypothetical protein